MLFQSGFNHSHDKPLPPTPTHPTQAAEEQGGTLILRHVSLSPQRRKRSNSSNLMRDPQQLIGGSRSSLNHLANIGKQTSAPEVGKGKSLFLIFQFIQRNISGQNDDTQKEDSSDDSEDVEVKSIGLEMHIHEPKAHEK